MYEVYANGGLLDWSVLRVTRRRPLSRQFERFTDWLFQPPIFTYFLYLRLLTVLCLFALMFTVASEGRIASFLSLAVLVQLLLLRNRSAYGLDGSDHMYIVIFLGLTVTRLMPPYSWASAAGLFYIAFQSGLSYLISGLAKIAGPSWRDGSAIAGVMTTKIYGNQIAASFLSDRPSLCRVLCWGVIVFEVLFIGALFSGPQFMWSMIVAGFVFHASAAVLMGLNSFFFAFLSAYPAIVYVNSLIRHYFH